MFKKRIFSKVGVLSAVLLLLLSVAGQFINIPHAAAKGEDYVVYFSQSGSTMTPQEYQASAIYAKDGVFGSDKHAIKLSAAGGAEFSTVDKDTNGDLGKILRAYYSYYQPAINGEHGFYIGTYQCNGYTIELGIGLTQATSSNTTGLGTQKVVNSNIWVLGGKKNNKTYSGKSIPSSCRPAGSRTASEARKTVSLPVYTGLSTLAQAAWFEPTGHAIGVLPNPQSPSAGGSNNGSNNDTSPTCESGGDPLNWILCPIFNAVAGISDWLFQQVVEPLLRTAPISVDPNDCNGGKGNCTYQIWSNFRIYGDIFLVIALLVVVFGQSIGGGLIDAYTAKKVLPRLVAAVVLINLSIYIVAALVDITNIVGGSIGDLMTAPIKHAGAFRITPSGVQAGTILAGGAAGLGLAAVALAVMAKVGALADLLSAGLLFVIMPVFFGMLAAFITLVLRQAIILALVLVSPVAFALYCLPNTAQYFRKWWDFLIQTLMVYPIVIVFFAVSDILSVTIYQTGNNNGVVGPLAAVISFVLQFLPLVFIPYAFRLAGGALGKMHEALSNYQKRGQEAIKGNANDPNSLRNDRRRKVANRFTDARGVAGSRLSSSNSAAARFIGRRVRGPRQANLEAARNVARAQAIEQTWAAGDDSWAKASTIPLSSLEARRGSARWRAADDHNNNSGQEQWRSADGTWFTRSQIAQGNREYGGQGADMQTNFRKLAEKTEPMGVAEQNAVQDDYIDWANQAGLDPGTATGRWQGIAIPLKAMRIDARRSRIGGERGDLHRDGVDHRGLLTEYGGMAMHEQVKETPGSFQAIRDSVLAAAAPTVPASAHEAADQQATREAAARAYHNLKSYVEGAATPQGAQQMAQQLAQQQQAQAGTAATYSSSSSAAAKNRQAAQQALADIEARRAADPALDQVIGTLPRDIT